MDYVEQIQRAIDSIEEHLDEPISIADIARVAGISRWHFQRIFKALTGETVKTYIRSRRLAVSLNKLLHTRERILDIALVAGFESQAAFTRAFKKQFGVTPAAYRRLGKGGLFPQKFRIDADYLEHISSGVSREPDIVIRPPTRLIGIKTACFGVDSERDNVAEKLPPLWDAFIPRLHEIDRVAVNVCYGLLAQEAEGSERLTYVAGAEAREFARVPDGMVSVEAPGGTYAQFTHRGPVMLLNNTFSYIYSTWLLRAGRRHTYGPDLEIYGSEYHPTAAFALASIGALALRREQQIDIERALQGSLVEGRIVVGRSDPRRLVLLVEDVGQGPDSRGDSEAVADLQERRGVLEELRLE